jgi:hypothetical protein
MNDDLQPYLDALQRGGVKVPPAAQASIRRQLAQFSGALDERARQELIQKFLDGLKSIAHPEQEDRGPGQSVTVGQTPASLTGDLSKFLSTFESGAAIADALNLRFKLDVATRVMRGAGHFLTDQTDVDEYPAWAFHRIYDRMVPRGFKAGAKGLIPIDDDDWPARWADAGDQAGDDDWLEWEGDSQTGRGVALKSSGMWIALGNVRDDCLGNGFAPFAFNSGFGTDGVPYNECVQLGLIDDGDQPRPAVFDFSKLFSLL